MKFIKNLGGRLNPMQKTIVAITVPFVLLVITYTIASDTGFDGNAFDMDETWLIWIIFLVIVGYFEFNLYSDKN